MSTKIILKKSSVSGRIPDSGDLQYGELALNYADGTIYYKASDNVVRSISAGLDSSLVSQLVDSSYVQARQVDSQRDADFITNIIDSAYVLARAPAQDFLDSSEALALIDANSLDSSRLDGHLASKLGAANQLVIVDSSGGTTVTSTDVLTIDPSNQFVGINTSNPEVTLHMEGDGAQTAQIRMEQANDTADAPDIRTRRYRGTLASPSDLNTGDYVFRLNVEGQQGGSIQTYGSMEFDVDGADADAVDWNLKLRDSSGNTNSRIRVRGGAVTFNGAYTFPAADGSANQILVTDGTGGLSFSNQQTLPSLGNDFVDSAEVVKLITANAIDSSVALQLLLDSIETIQLIDSSYVQARQIQYNTSDFVDSAYVTSQLPTFGTDFIDSATASSIVDSALSNAVTFTGQVTAAASGNSFIINDTLRIDSAGSGLRMTNIGAFDRDGSGNFRVFSNEDLVFSTNGGSGTALTLNKTTKNATFEGDIVVRGNTVTVYDSNSVATVVDSNYVQARQDFAYGSLTGAPTIPTLGTSFVDSAEVIKLISSNQHSIDSGYFTANVPTFGTDFVDSAVVSSLITSTVTSAYIQTRQGLIDSGLVTQLVDSAYVALRDKFNDSDGVLNFVDSDYVQARQNFAYGSLTGTPTIPSLGNDFVDSAFVTSQLPTFGTDFVDSGAVTTLIDSAYIQARQVDNQRDSAFVKTVQYADNEKLIFGDSDDFQFYHTGSHNRIETSKNLFVNVGDGNFFAISGDEQYETKDLVISGSRTGTGGAVSRVKFRNRSGSDTISASTAETNIEAWRINSATPSLTFNFGGTERHRFDDDGKVALGAVPGSFGTITETVEITGTLKTTGRAKLNDGATITSDLIVDSATISGLNYPTSDGTNGQVLTTDGSGALTFTTITSLDSAQVLVASGNFIATTDSGNATFANEKIHWGVKSGSTGLVELVGRLAYVDSQGNDALAELSFGGGGSGTDSSQVSAIVASDVDSAYVQLRQTAQDFAYSSLTGAPSILDSTGVTNIIDSSYVGARTSGYTSLRDYTSYVYTPSTSTTAFSGADDNGNTLSYASGYVEVYLNGSRLVTGLDYTETSSSVLTLGEAIDSPDTLEIISLGAVVFDQSHISTKDGDFDSSGNNQILDTFNKATYRTTKYLVQIEKDSDNKYHSEELLLTHNGTTVATTTYAQILMDSNLGTFDADIVGDNVRLKFSPTYANTSVKTKVIRMDA